MKLELIGAILAAITLLVVAPGIATQETLGPYFCHSYGNDSWCYYYNVSFVDTVFNSQTQQYYQFAPKVTIEHQPPPIGRATNILIRPITIDGIQGTIANITVSGTDMVNLSDSEIRSQGISVPPHFGKWAYVERPAVFHNMCACYDLADKKRGIGVVVIEGSDVPFGDGVSSAANVMEAINTIHVEMIIVKTHTTYTKEPLYVEVPHTETHTEKIPQLLSQLIGS